MIKKRESLTPGRPTPTKSLIPPAPSTPPLPVPVCSRPPRSCRLHHNTDLLATACQWISWNGSVILHPFLSRRVLTILMLLNLRGARELLQAEDQGG
ncbi:hypothetical protein FA95DRAFT_1554761 [Auriscalpium vulgare]|uniref:Uncharacterized protein n=1 Tax=Auriscalpium vulgare TaxID=40419 RepID=A0ACB8S3S1_9AGAM|nr:hypothetical protein FA95DRAFT_1554761 [Auriscalpium vulgare]